MLINFLVLMLQRTINLKYEKTTKIEEIFIIFLAAQLAQTVKFCSQMWLIDCISHYYRPMYVCI